MGSLAHPELHLLHKKLRNIYEALLNFRPLAGVPPILDSSIDADPNDDGQWLRHENIPGIKKLRESIKFDIDILDKFLSDPASEHEQPISTHAPYLVSVYHEILAAPPPIVSVFKFLQLNPCEGADRRNQKGARRPPSTKVDVVAENGRRWIRINTIKNAGILAELRENDSYLTDSDSDSDPDDPDYRPSIAPTELSILQMGRTLIEAANANPIEGVDGPEIPRVTIRLTRLDTSPFRANGEPNDPRIAHAVQCLRDLGIDVELGERPESEIPLPLQPPAPTPTIQLQPTRQINLDLSVLVALVSDLTHSPLPASVEEATARFLPPQQYREWKPLDRIAADGSEAVDGANAQDIARHSRALTTHILQEMGKGLLQEIKDKLSIFSNSDSGPVEFWTSEEARERCMRIVSRIGGVREVKRAEALFPSDPISDAEAEAQFWRDSRYPRNFIPLLPIRIYPAPPLPPVKGAPEPHSQFFRSMTKVCRDLLATEAAQAQMATPPTSNGSSSRKRNEDGDGEAHQASSKINSRLSPHAVKSLLRGAELGWTTLTTTKSSVKALLREIKTARLAGRLVEDVEADENAQAANSTAAAIWIVDPRNLQCFI
ncbi:hypothetical protein MSAN_02463800 [Mycena sanguinolenta]|uniref:DUF1308 domain-containing protein n=1 Tax=Mycena sanguinolenta TaxID=230812 RepID=A0A8H6WWW8_9AGAR|nr:hypothetical protein MSAN_02463800 [Mycena sanguinolenta]